MMQITILQRVEKSCVINEMGITLMEILTQHAVG